MAASRTEQPTRRRMEDARKRGQVSRSREVDTALALLAAFAAFRFGGSRLWEGLQTLLRDSFAVLGRDPLTVELTAATGSDLVLRALVLLLPLLLTIMAVSLLGGFVQAGPVFSTQAVRPKASRLNPLAGARRILASKQALMALVRSVLKLAIAAGVAALVIRARMDVLTSLGVAMSLEASLGVLASVGFEIVLKVILALVVVAAADFLFQRSDLMGQLRMTRQEVKDEMRQTEGDPLVRGRIARVRRSFMARVMEAVPRADVVLTNPTSYAVALKYDPATDQAPTVLAKGERMIAERIRELALEHNIPVVQDPPLTRAIHRAIPIGQEITPDLYSAVAEVLAFVYRLRSGTAQAVA